VTCFRNGSSSSLVANPSFVIWSSKENNPRIWALDTNAARNSSTSRVGIRSSLPDSETCSSTEPCACRHHTLVQMQHIWVFPWDTPWPWEWRLLHRALVGSAPPFASPAPAATDVIHSVDTSEWEGIASYTLLQSQLKAHLIHTHTAVDSRETCSCSQLMLFHPLLFNPS
jgi:hypothetical protein